MILRLVCCSLSRSLSAFGQISNDSERMDSNMWCLYPSPSFGAFKCIINEENCTCVTLGGKSFLDTLMTLSLYRLDSELTEQKRSILRGFDRQSVSIDPMCVKELSTCHHRLVWFLYQFLSSILPSGFVIDWHSPRLWGDRDNVRLDLVLDGEQS